MKKVFKENGELTVRFAADATEQIKEWLGSIDLEHAMKFAKKIDNCRVFGNAIEFPCEIE